MIGFRNFIWHILITLLLRGKQFEINFGSVDFQIILVDCCLIVDAVTINSNNNIYIILFVQVLDLHSIQVGAQERDAIQNWLSKDILRPSVIVFVFKREVPDHSLVLIVDLEENFEL